eukprot:jgi/Botrbrau1/7323/Bobra.247_3s0018.1
MDKQELGSHREQIQRGDVLGALDNARFQSYHIRALAITMVTFFSDSYLLFATSVITPMIGVIYFRDEPHNGTLPELNDYWLKGTALVGTFVGMLFFGWYGDYVGRKRAYLPALVLMLIGTLGCTLSSPLATGTTVTGIFSFYRFIAGVGIGGDYPLVACMASEYANKKWRGTMIAAVFSMQGFGILSASLVGMAATRAFKDAILRDVMALDYVWRIVVGMGMLPILAAFLLRRSLPESPRYTLDVSNNVTLAQSNIQALMGLGRVEEDRGSSKARRITWETLWAYMVTHRRLIALPALAWLLLDIGYYSQAMFQSNVLATIHYLPDVDIRVPASVYEWVLQTCTGLAIGSMMGTVPGYFFAVATIDRLGRRFLQACGLLLMGICLMILGTTYNPGGSRAQAWGFIAIYSLTMFFANAGPNTTTFVIPAELYPTRFRATLFGVCAAAGKLGAVAATFGVSHIRTRVSLGITCIVLAIPSFIAAAFTALIPETGGRSLEQNAGERAEDAPAGDGGAEGGEPEEGLPSPRGTGGAGGGWGFPDWGFPGFSSFGGSQPGSSNQPVTDDAFDACYEPSGATNGRSHGAKEPSVPVSPFGEGSDKVWRQAYGYLYDDRPAYRGEPKGGVPEVVVVADQNGAAAHDAAGWDRGEVVCDGKVPPQVPLDRNSTASGHDQPEQALERRSEPQETPANGRTVFEVKLRKAEVAV